MTEELDDLEQQWPGVEPAQAFVIPCYGWMLSRLEAADSRIQNFLSLVLTVTLAMPTLGRALRRDIPFTSYWFLVAMGLAVATVAIGIYGRARGSIILPHPNTFWERWLGRTEWEFQKDALRFAGHHFESNVALVKWKSVGVTTMSILFAFEVALLIIWIGRA